MHLDFLLSRLFQDCGRFPCVRPDGAIAQLGERLHGMQEVSGSIPLGSTKPSHAAARRHFRFQLSRLRIMSDTTLAVKSTMGTMRA